MAETEMCNCGHAPEECATVPVRHCEAAEAAGDARSFQGRVKPWMVACFGEEISGDRLERGDRFVEEALELLQSGGYPRERAHALIDYVYARPSGEPAQEAGGVMVTLAAYCLAHALDMHEAGEVELARIWTKMEKIRAKQAAKPTGSALPIAAVPPAPAHALPVIEQCPHDWTREYIPLPGGWELQSKGGGSTMRVLDTKSGERRGVFDPCANSFLHRMAREIHAACSGRPPQAPDFVRQNGELPPGTASMAWFNQVEAEMRAAGATSFRFSVHDHLKNLAMVEGWMVEPGNPGPVQWALTAKEAARAS